MYGAEKSWQDHPRHVRASQGQGQGGGKGKGKVDYIPPNSPYLIANGCHGVICNLYG